jgi:hypothetical protein
MLRLAPLRQRRITRGLQSISARSAPRQALLLMVFHWIASRVSVAGSTRFHFPQCSPQRMVPSLWRWYKAPLIVFVIYPLVVALIASTFGLRKVAFATFPSCSNSRVGRELERVRGGQRWS